MDHPQFRYDLQNGFVDPTRDLLPGAAREWFSVQHWVAAQQGGVTAALIPVDAELIALGDIVRGQWPIQLGERQGTVFSYVMNNYWFTNYVAGQGGDYTFRYVLTSGTNLEPGALSRLGWEEMTPLETNEITESDKEFSPPRPLSAAAESFLQVSPPNVVLVNWKTAENGHGTILRFLELAGKPGEVSVHIPIVQVEAAWMCNAMEENQQPLSTAAQGFSFSVKPFQIVTVRVEGAAVR
jgi:alpha-mannosidase